MTTGARGATQLLRQYAKTGLTHIVGIDPDLKNTAICHWSLIEDCIEDLAVTHRKSPSKGQQAAADMAKLVRDAVCRFPHYDKQYSPLLVIEGQRVRKYGNKTVNPQSLVDLACCTGVVIGVFTQLFRRPFPVVVVEPAMWKGNVPKEIQHSRTLRALGLEPQKKTGYAVPKGIGKMVEGQGVRIGGSPVTARTKINPGDWKDLMDAIGIAKWGAETINDFAG